MNWPRVIVGIGLWCALGAGVWLWAGSASEGTEDRGRWWSDVWRYGQGPRRSLDVNLSTSREVAVGDPLFVRDEDGTLRQIGEIVRLTQAGQTLSARQAQVQQAQAMLYPGAPELSERAQVQYVSTPESLTWVVQTLLPPERKAEIARELSSTIEAHRDEILQELRPVAEKSLRESLAILEQDLPAAVARHRPQLQAIGTRYHQDIVEDELVPLVKEEIWPIVRRHGEPTANEVGGEIWKRVSLWRFGWRYVYDRSVLPEKHLVEREWQRFVEQEAMPILQEHSGDFLRVVEDSLKDSARNPQVRSVLRRSLGQMMDDPELQQVLGSIFREAVVDNPRLRESLARNWTGPEAQRAFRVASDRLEPTVRRIGDMVFGTPETGISPEFAQVLRNQILHKDRRWFLLTEPSSSSPDFVESNALAARDSAG